MIDAMTDTALIAPPDAPDRRHPALPWPSVVSIAKSYDKRAVLTDISLSVGQGRGVGPARAQWRGQDHLLLFDHGAGAARCRAHPARRRRYHQPADVPPRDPRPWLSAAGNLDLPGHDGRTEHQLRARTDRAGSRQSAPSELERLLEEFDLTRLRDSPAMALSGGERRRCEIARALAADALDHAARRALRRHRSAVDRRHPRSGEGSQDSAASAC